MAGPSVQYEERYFLGVQTTAITTAVAFDGSTIGIGAGEPALKVTNNPSLNPGVEFVQQVKAHGQSTQQKSAGANNEIQLHIPKPTVSLEFDLNANNLTLAMWLLLQGGISEAATTPFVKTAVPYTSPVPIVWGSIVHEVESATAGENQAIHGCIASSLTIASDATSQSVKATIELMGRSHVDTIDTSAFTTVDPLIDVLLFKNMTALLDANGVDIESFSITIVNNAISKWYHGTVITKHLLNRIGVEGEFVIPRDSGDVNEDENEMLVKLKALTDFLFTVSWGNSPATTDGDVSLITNVFATGVEKIETDGELGYNVSFEGADDLTNDFSWTWADLLDRGI